MFQIQTFSLASLENNCNRGKWIRRTAGRDCKVGHKNEKGCFHFYLSTKTLLIGYMENRCLTFFEKMKEVIWCAHDA